MKERKTFILILVLILSVTFILGVSIVMLNLKNIAPFGISFINISENSQNSGSSGNGNSNSDTHSNNTQNDVTQNDNTQTDDNSSETPAEPTGHVLVVGDYGIITDSFAGLYNLNQAGNGPGVSFQFTFSTDCYTLENGCMWCLSFLDNFPSGIYDITVGEVIDDIDPILGIDSLGSCSLSFIGSEGFYNDDYTIILDFDDSDDSVLSLNPRTLTTDDYYIFVVGHYLDVINCRNFVVDGYSVGGFEGYSGNKNDYRESYYPY